MCARDVFGPSKAPTLERKVLRGRDVDRLGSVSAIQYGVRDRTTISWSGLGLRFVFVLGLGLGLELGLGLGLGLGFGLGVGVGLGLGGARPPYYLLLTTYYLLRTTYLGHQEELDLPLLEIGERAVRGLLGVGVGLGLGSRAVRGLPKRRGPNA